MKPKTLHRGKYLHLVDDGGWEYIKRTNCTGIVVIVAATPEGEAVLVEQYRPALRKKIIEWPAGLVSDLGKKETLLSAARREFLEETGYRAARFQPILSGPISSGFSADILSFFLASGLTRVSDGGGDGTEFITVHRVPMFQIDSWIKKKKKNGCLVDPKVYTGIYFLERAKSPVVSHPKKRLKR